MVSNVSFVSSFSVHPAGGVTTRILFSLFIFFSACFVGQYCVTRRHSEMFHGTALDCGHCRVVVGTNIYSSSTAL